MKRQQIRRGGALGIRYLLALSLVVAFASRASVSVAQVTLTPDTIDLMLTPGEMFTETKTVTIPGGGAPVDIYFLADTTGSMQAVIDQVQSDAAAILTAVRMDLTDVRFGVGEYRDFLGMTPTFAFRNDTSITDNDTDVVNGINMWAAALGGDGSEGQLFALNQLSDPSDPAGIGWRDNAIKIIVWFGDAPGHDPICTAASGEAADITEAGVTQQLVDNGYIVIAIGVTTSGTFGFPLRLNDDPTANAFDYTGVCTIGGTAGQANRITAATDGVSLDDVAPSEVTDAILMAISMITQDVTVALVPDGDTAPYTMVLTPPYVDVPLPGEGENLVLEFDVKFTGPPCEGPENLVLSGFVNAVVDDAVAATQTVTLRQKGCENTAPSCDPGGELVTEGETTTNVYVVECSSNPGMVALDGSGSSDADGDSLTYSWATDCPGGTFDDSTSPTPVLSLDTSDCADGEILCTVVLVVSDGTESSTCTAEIRGSAGQPIPDCNENGISDLMEQDSDGDGIIDDCDNCPNTPNPGQEDSNGDGIGDACTSQPASQPTSQPAPACGIGLCGFGTFGMMPFMLFGLGLTRMAFRRRRVDSRRK